MMSVDQPSLKLSLSNGHCFIWNAADARYLREELRMVGTLVGCLPRAPRQNAHLGLPLQLMPEEVTLLVEKGYAQVVEEMFETPTEADIQKYTEQQDASYKEQIELFREETRNEMKRRLPQIIEGKRTKRNMLLQLRRDKGEHIEDGEFEREIMFDPDKVDIPAISEQHALIQTPLACQHRQVTCRVVDWRYPETDRHKLRYRVYKDMWERGHYLTSGTKFGGDFLAYPGDPSRFHSLFIVICKAHTRQMSALEVISMGRLGTNVKKTALVCSVDDSGQVCYTSLEWTGIS